MTNKTETTKAKAPPVARVRVRAVQGTIWARSTEKGTFYDVTFERGYKTQDGWKSSRSFGLDDLLALQHAVGLAIDKVMELRAADVSDEAASYPVPEDFGDEDEMPL